MASSALHRRLDGEFLITIENYSAVEICKQRLQTAPPIPGLGPWSVFSVRLCGSEIWGMLNGSFPHLVLCSMSISAVPCTYYPSEVIQWMSCSWWYVVFHLHFYLKRLPTQELSNFALWHMQVHMCKLCDDCVLGLQKPVLRFFRFLVRRLNTKVWAKSTRKAPYTYILLKTIRWAKVGWRTPRENWKMKMKLMNLAPQLKCEYNVYLLNFTLKI